MVGPLSVGAAAPCPSGTGGDEELADRYTKPTEDSRRATSSRQDLLFLTRKCEIAVLNQKHGRSVGESPDAMTGAIRSADLRCWLVGSG